MSIVKKLADGKYQVRVSRGTGSRRREISKTFYGTLKDANAYGREQETLLHTGRLSTTRLTFDAYFRLWLAAVKPKLAPRTHDGYEGTITRYALDALSSIRIRDIESPHIQKIYNGLTKLSPTTVSNLHASLNACFAWGVRHDHIKTNPCKNTDRPKKIRPDIVVMDELQAMAFVDHCQELKLGVMFELALETGMRPEEYLALQWKDIRGNDISVVRSVQENRKVKRPGDITKGGGYYFKEIKTKHGRRRIPISEPMRRRLVTHRREQNEHRLAMKGTWFNNDLVFANMIGQPISLANATNRYFRPIMDKCEFPQHLTLYSLRHTCATLLLMAGENPKVVSERLGHASVVITLDTYSHVLPHIQDKATSLLDGIMRRA